ncbi:MAG: hypothetical protein KKA32_12810 [Actinobacteria bacterium]|nr:hypothetical protein [Actinomycetota bacterium]
MFPCRSCGRTFEVQGEALVEGRPRTAAVTSELAIPPDVRYLAVWRFLAAVEVVEKRSAGGSPPESAWEQIRRVAAPDPPFLFAPAFTLARGLVQQLGLGLVQAQPQLELRDGLPDEGPTRPLAVSEAASVTAEGWAHDPDDRTLSPVLVGRADAEVVAHFVYLALESRTTRGLRSIDYDLSLTGGELLFLPAAFDPRYVRDSGWRLLLREFDGMVA